MIHTKSLIRRLTHVPWLLAVGLVLGLAGESMAQTTYSVSLEFDETELRIREEADATKVNLTAKIVSAGDKVKAPAEGLDVEVVFAVAFANDVTAADDDNLESRFRIVGGRFITIPEGEITKVTEFSIDPQEWNTTTTDDNTNAAEDIVIHIADSRLVGSRGTVDSENTWIRIIDNDKPSTAVYFSISPSEVKKADGTQNVTVTAFLNGATLPDHEVHISFAPEDEASPVRVPATATRDDHFDLRALDNPLKIDKTKVSGVEEFTLKNKAHEFNLQLVLMGTVTVPLVSGKVLPDGAFGGDGTITGNLAPDAASGLAFSTERVAAAGDVDTEDVESRRSILLPGEAAKPAVAKVEPYPNFIRETEEDVEITLTVTLEEDVEKDASATVRFGIRNDTAVRDTHFDPVTVPDPIEITEGKTGEAILIVTSLMDVGKDRAFEVTARLEEETEVAIGTILIVDSETATTKVFLEVVPDTLYEKDADGRAEVMVTARLKR